MRDNLRHEAMRYEGDMHDEMDRGGSLIVWMLGVTLFWIGVILFVRWMLS